MTVEKKYEETWTCDCCGEQMTTTEMRTFAEEAPEGWNVLGFLIDFKTLYKPEYNLCSECMDKWVRETNRVLAKFVFSEKQFEAFEAGVPLADILGE